MCFFFEITVILFLSQKSLKRLQVVQNSAVGFLRDLITLCLFSLLELLLRTFESFNIFLFLSHKSIPESRLKSKSKGVKAVSVRAPKPWSEQPLV